MDVYRQAERGNPGMTAGRLAKRLDLLVLLGLECQRCELSAVLVDHRRYRYGLVEQAAVCEYPPGGRGEGRHYVHDPSLFLASED